MQLASTLYVVTDNVTAAPSTRILRSSPERVEYFTLGSLTKTLTAGQPLLNDRTSVKPNTHRRRRRDETVLSRRVGVGGVYMNSRRLPTDSNAQSGRRRPVYNTAANGS